MSEELIEKAFWLGFQKRANSIDNGIQSLIDYAKQGVGNLGSGPTIPSHVLEANMFSKGLGEGGIGALLGGGVGMGAGALLGHGDNPEKGQKSNRAMLMSLLGAGGAGIGGIGGAAHGGLDAITNAMKQYPGGIKFDFNGHNGTQPW